MAKCSLPHPRLVFCSHLQCVHCINYVDDDGFPIGHCNVIFPPDYCQSLSDVRNFIADEYIFRVICKNDSYEIY